jgi:hypothetical protein
MIKFLVILLLLINTYSNKLLIKLINTPVYHFIPIIKLHSIAVLQNNVSEKNHHNNQDIFLIDFSPIDDISSPDVIFKIIQGKPIRGKIRVLCFSQEDSKSIIRENSNKDLFLNNNKLMDNLDPIISNENLKKLKKIDPYIVTIINLWDPSFQIYKRNCRHFSKFLFDKLNNRKIEY